jgi:TolA-binding protein
MQFVLLSVSQSAEDQSSLKEARALIKEKKYNQATRILEAKKPKSPKFLKDDIGYWLAYIHYKQGKYELAKKELYEVVRNYTGEDMADDALLLLGQIQIERGDCSKGLQTYEQLYNHYQYKETAPEALYRIAEYYLNKGEDDKTIYLLKKINKEYSEYAKYKKTSELIEKIEDRRRKIEEAKKKKEPKPEKKTIVKKPAIQKPLTDREKAKRYVERRKFPEGGKHQIYWLKMVILEAKRRLKKVVKEEEKKELAAYTAKCSFWLASSLKEIGLYQEARKIYGTIIKEYSGIGWYAKESKYEISISYWKEGKPEIALRLLDKYMREYPSDDSVLAHSMKADILYQTGKYHKAIKAFNEYKEAFPNTSQIDWIHLRICQCYYRLEQYEEAKYYLEQFLMEYPNSYFAPCVKRLLNKVKKKFDK